jgi:branched-chain amino acid transport system permease protein
MILYKKEMGIFIIILQNIVFGVLLGSIYALAAIGLSLMFGVVNLTNFAHGDFIMLAMYISYFIGISLYLDPIMTPLISVPLFFLLGIAVYLTIFHKIIRAPPLSQIAVTVGLLVLLRNFALAVWHAEPKSISKTVLGWSFRIGPILVPADRLTGMIISVATFIVLYLFLNKTRTGIAMRALADDLDSAALMGVNVRNLNMLTCALGIGIVALAGSILMTFQPVNPLTGLIYGLLTWSIMAMAGLGGVSGVLLSGIIFGIADAFTAAFWDPRAREITIYLLFILLLWFKPKGLFGRR